MPRAPGQRLELVGVQDGPVDAQPHVAVLVGTTQPKQAPKPHAIPDSSASWAGTPRSAQIARTASSIGGGPQA